MQDLVSKLRNQRLYGWRLIKSLSAIIILFIIIDFCFPISIDKHYSLEIAAADGTLLHAFLTPDDKWRLYTRIDEITPDLRNTLLYKEDRYFYYHPGVNPVALLRAAFVNLIHWRRTSGASTITMQVVRLLEPRPRTYVNKLIEIFRALQLEWHYSKEAILQLYINLLPYGGNIEGIRAAAMSYFGKPPQVLSAAQVVTLTIIPNRPSSLRPGKQNEQLRAARDKKLKAFAAAGIIKDLEAALAEPLGISRQPLPRLANHLCYRLKNSTNSLRIRATLHTEIQAQVQEITKQYIEKIKSLQITNASVLVVENATRNVLAYVGSADFENQRFQGQVDGVRALRSPGSTLKPLLFAQAIDLGLLTPATVLYDVPQSYNGYEPENSDRKFRGPVSAGFALAASLNIPAVSVLEQVSIPTFVNLLRKAGLREFQQDGRDLGLSMILGACVTRLEALAGLYAALAGGGAYKPLCFTTDTLNGYSTDSAVQLVSPEAAWLITQMLTQLSRPDLPAVYAQMANLPKIAWKTGTSFGKRDAWAIGYNPRYTVAVWCGNFNGSGSPFLNGTDIAVPLLFQIFSNLPEINRREWYVKPPALAMRTVCRETGRLPDVGCTNQLNDYYIPGVSFSTRCTHQQSIWVSADEKVRYCITCLPAQGAVQKMYPNPPPALLAWQESQQLVIRRIPPHYKGCTRVGNTLPPKIIFPANGSTVWIKSGKEAAIALEVQTDPHIEKVYWFVNNRFLKAEKARKAVFFKPDTGFQHITCTDDLGNHHSIRFRVGVLD
jgi:penicillin-binding protein 1C